MATKKRAKRFDGLDGSMVGIPAQTEEEAANEEAMTSAMMRKRAMEEGARDEKAMPYKDFMSEKEPGAAAPVSRSRSMPSGPMRKPSTPMPSPMAKSAPSGAPSTGASLKAMESSSESKAPKKDMYRGFDGKMREKAAPSDSFKGAREAIGSGLKSAGEGIGSYLKNLGKREEKHGKYRDFSGKVVEYSKGGSTSGASKRADGIAQRGKTRGKMC